MNSSILFELSTGAIIARGLPGWEQPISNSPGAGKLGGGPAILPFCSGKICSGVRALDSRSCYNTRRLILFIEPSCLRVPKMNRRKFLQAGTLLSMGTIGASGIPEKGE
jgi:hypothetical protein